MLDASADKKASACTGQWERMMSESLSPEVRDLPEDRVFDFDFYNIPGITEDFHTPWKALQDRSAPHSLIWTPQNGGHWIAMRAKAIREVISDPARFSSYRMTIPPGTDRSARWDVLPISLDPPQHGPYRRLLNAGLSPRAVNERAERIRALAVSLIEGFRPRGRCEFVRDYAEEFPIKMIFIVMDLNVEDKPKMMKVISKLTTPDGSMTVAEIVEEFSNFLRPYIRDRIGRDGSDLISQICNGRIDGRPISEQESVQMCVQTFAAGLESVRNALSFTMLDLARHPETRRVLRENSASLQRAADEFLRRYSAMVMAREVVDDMEYDGVRLAKGDLIACPAHLAGLDEHENRCPMDVDFQRDNRISVAFGAGPHFCAGRWLANVEIKVTLEEWLARIPEFSIEPGAEVHFSGGILGSVNALPLVW